MVGYYRKFVRAFSDIAKPLTELTKKDVSFAWTKEQEDAFDTLRTALCKKPVLIYPDFQREFILTTDASGTGISVILSQEVNGHKHPIAYASRQLNAAERNYSTTERELLGVVYGIKQYRCYLYGRKFKIITDHRPLKWIMSLKQTTSRLSRWALSLSEYEFEVVHRPGKLMANADALSRRPICTIGYEPIWDRQRIKEEQERDENLKEIITEVQQSGSNENFALDADGILYRNRKGEERQDRIVVPVTMVGKILNTFHDTPMGGHLGYQKTVDKIRGMFYWKNMKSDVKKYCESCQPCNERKTPTNRKPAPLQRLPEVNGPFERTSMDIVGPLRKSDRGNKYLLTFMDTFSRYAEAIPIPDQSAITVAKAFVTNVVTRHGVPRQLLTDLGTNFVSALFKEICSLLKINKIQTTAFHPQTNGIIERSHQTLINILSQFIGENQSDWDEWMPYVLMAYRSSIHSATGETPHYLLYGRDFELPFEDILKPRRVKYDLDTNYASELIQRLDTAYKRVKEKLRQATERQEAQQHPHSTPVKFKKGDKVYLHSPKIKPGLSKKLCKLWKGPYRIISQQCPVTFKIRKIGETKDQTVHANRLKLYRDYSSPEEGCTSDEEEEVQEEEQQENENSIRIGHDQEELYAQAMVMPEEIPLMPIQPAPGQQAIPRRHRYNTRSVGDVEDLPWVMDVPIEYGT